MLWFKLLQNTIYCGKLHVTSYYQHKKASWGGFVRCKQQTGEKRKNQKFLTFAPFAAVPTLVLPQTTTKEEG